MGRKFGVWWEWVLFLGNVKNWVCFFVLGLGIYVMFICLIEKGVIMVICVLFK